MLKYHELSLPHKNAAPSAPLSYATAIVYYELIQNPSFPMSLRKRAVNNLSFHVTLLVKAYVTLEIWPKTNFHKYVP